MVGKIDFQLSRIQNSVAPDDPDHPQTFSYPTSAVHGHEDYGARKTWSAPNKDPFGGGLGDPFQRRSGRPGQSQGYEPSFGGSGDNGRGHRRGGGGTGGWNGRGVEDKKGMIWFCA